MDEQSRKLAGERLELLKSERQRSERLIEAIQGEGLHDIGPEFIVGEAERIARLEREIVRCEALLHATRS